LGDPLPHPGNTTFILPSLAFCRNNERWKGNLSGPSDFPGVRGTIGAQVPNELQQRMSDINEGTVGLFFTGFIDYEDIFFRWRRTQVCLFFNRTTRTFNFCPGGTEAS
jgi:hypothetical protein